LYALKQNIGLCQYVVCSRAWGPSEERLLNSGKREDTDKLKDIVLVLFLSLTLFSLSIRGDDSHQVDIRIVDDSGNQSETWIGVFDEKLDTLTNPSEWIFETEHIFSLSLPKNREDTTLILLRKDKVPVVILVTLELIADGLEVEFSEGSVIPHQPGRT